MTDKTFGSMLTDDSREELRKAFEEMRIANEKSANEFWDSLTYDQKCDAFHAVVRRIFDGEIKVKGSYRYVLYDVFGFDMDSYGVGMECGYMELHNSIIPKDEQAEYREWWYAKHGGKLVDKVTVKLDKDDDDAEV